MNTVRDRHQAEIDYWRTSVHESPESWSVHNIVNKVGDAGVFLHLLGRYSAAFRGRIIELGAGQGWASCLVKRIIPSACVIATDISPHAIASAHKWERLWEARLDGAYSCKSYETREADASIDLAFCFASAHHFAAMPETLVEIARILKPGGSALFLYEPTSPSYLYPLARWRLNRIRQTVPEDVLVPADISRQAADAGLQVALDYCPSIEKRSPGATVYYSVLKAVPILQSILPCTGNFIFSRGHG